MFDALSITPCADCGQPATHWLHETVDYYRYGRLATVTYLTSRDLRLCAACLVQRVKEAKDAL